MSESHRHPTVAPRDSTRQSAKPARYHRESRRWCMRQFDEDNPYYVTVPNGLNFHLPNGTTVPGNRQIPFNVVACVHIPSPIATERRHECPPGCAGVFRNHFCSGHNRQRRITHSLQASWRSDCPTDCKHSWLTLEQVDRCPRHSSLKIRKTHFDPTSGHVV